MPKYKVSIPFAYIESFYIEAETPEHAVEKAHERIEAGEEGEQEHIDHNMDTTVWDSDAQEWAIG